MFACEFFYFCPNGIMCDCITTFVHTERCSVPQSSKVTVWSSCCVASVKCYAVLSVHESVTDCRRLWVKMKEGWNRGAWREGFPLLLCALYLPTCSDRGNHFSIPIHRTSSLMYSPCLCLSHSASLSHSRFVSKLPRSSPPLLSFAFSQVLSPFPILSPVCLSLFSPAKLWGRSCFISYTTGDPSKTRCTYKDYSAASAKPSLTFTHAAPS